MSGDIETAKIEIVDSYWRPIPKIATGKLLGIANNFVITYSFTHSITKTLAIWFMMAATTGGWKTLGKLTYETYWQRKIQWGRRLHAQTEKEVARDSIKRSAVKATGWKLITFVPNTLITSLVLQDYSQAVKLVGLKSLSKLALDVVNDQLWTRVPWGVKRRAQRPKILRSLIPLPQSMR